MSISCALSSLSYRWPHPAIFLLFFLASYGFITQITLSALTLCVSLSLSFPPLMSFLFLLSNSHSLTLSWCFSLRQLMENKITTIERGAFQDLKELERLWVMMCWRHCVNLILYKISLPSLKNPKNTHASRFICISGCTDQQVSYKISFQLLGGHKLHYLSLLEVLQVCRALLLPKKHSLILCFGDSQGHCLNILTHCLLTALTVLSARGVLKKPFKEKIIWFAFVQWALNT